MALAEIKTSGWICSHALAIVVVLSNLEFKISDR